MVFWVRGTAAIAFSVLCSWACAITPSDIARLQVGSQLELPAVNVDIDAMVNMTVESVICFTDVDGYFWYRFDGTMTGGNPASLVVNVDKDEVEVESAITHMRLRDLGVNAKTIWKIDKLGKGEILVDDQHYKFNANESEDTQFSKDKSAPAKASYYRFESAEDDDLALLAFEWAEDSFEVLQLESVDAQKVHLK